MVAQAAFLLAGSDGKYLVMASEGMGIEAWSSVLIPTGCMAEYPGLGEGGPQTCSNLGALPLGLFLPSSVSSYYFSPCKHSCVQRFQKGPQIF